MTSTLWIPVIDSTVLAYILKLLNQRHNYGVNLILLSVDEGITGYRDDSLEVILYVIVYQYTRLFKVDWRITSILPSYKWTLVNCYKSRLMLSCVILSIVDCQTQPAAIWTTIKDSFVWGKYVLPVGNAIIVYCAIILLYGSSYINCIQINYISAIGIIWMDYGCHRTENWYEK